MVSGATTLPPGGIGPELPEKVNERSFKRTAVEALPSTSLPSKAKVAKSVTSKPFSGITGTWILEVQRPAVRFQYQFVQSEDQSVAGVAQCVDICDGHRSEVVGQVQGYVLIWSEDGHGRFRANLAADGQSFSGTGQLDSSFSLNFQASRQVDLPGREGASGNEFVFTDESGEMVRCSRQSLEEIPKLLQLSSAGTTMSCKDVLQTCPLEAAACSRLLALLRALGVSPQAHVTVRNAVHLLSLADWLGSSEGFLEVLVGALKASEIPAMLRAAKDGEDTMPPSIAKVLQRKLLIRDAESIEVLARDEDKDRWKALCGPAVLDCLRSLAEEDPDALRLSRAAFAAIELGLPAKEVHTVVPSRLRFGRAKNLFLDLHKRGLGPEGAARLEFPSSLRDLDLDLTRCNIRAVGAAALRFPDGLRRLRLILHKCDIGPEGAKALSLPSSLEHLELDLSHCLIGPVGATHLQVPRGLVDLELILLRCGIGAKGAKALMLPENLRKLRLDLAKCEIGVEGLKGLKLPPRLSSLNLDLSMCPLSLDAMKAFVLNLPKCLEVLEVNLTGCKIPPTEISKLQQVARSRLSNVSCPNFLT